MGLWWLLWGFLHYCLLPLMLLLVNRLYVTLDHALEEATLICGCEVHLLGKAYPPPAVVRLIVISLLRLTGSKRHDKALSVGCNSFSQAFL